MITTRLGVLLLGLVWLAGCAGPVRRTGADCFLDQCAHLYVVRRGWHVDVAFDTRELGPELSTIGLNFGSPRYLVIGFGDRRYLEHPSRWSLLAALWPGDGLMLVTGLSTPPARAFGKSRVVTLPIARQQMDAMQRFVAASFARSSTHSIHDGPYEGSLYFDATPRYSAAHTCNTWAAEVLRAGNVAIQPRGILFAGQLWSAISP